MSIGVILIKFFTSTTNFSAIFFVVCTWSGDQWNKVENEIQSDWNVFLKISDEAAMITSILLIQAYKAVYAIEKFKELW